MVTFSRSLNSVKIDFENELHFVAPDCFIISKGGKINIQSKLGSQQATEKYVFIPTEINGRPSDTADVVAEWLRDTYFYGDEAGGGGGGGDASAANQVTEIALLGAIETDVETLTDKTPSDLVTELHDYKAIVYTGGGDIDYVSYKLGGSGGAEVARLTMGYDGGGNLTSVTKT